MRALRGHQTVWAARRLWAALALGSLLGCSAAPYQYGRNLHTEEDAPLPPGETQIERGRPMPILDALGWVVGIPSKVIMLDHRVNNHDISPETEAKLQEYLASNRLAKVKVRLNEYDPVGEWERLVHNESVAWPLRYTFGTVNVLGYTLLPGRILGGDHYNPYTNSISLYSDVPGLALYEGGLSKDYAQREYKGLYAVAYYVPGVGLLCQDAHASADAMGYIRENGSPPEIKEGYRSVCPAYAVNATEPFEEVVGAPLILPAALVGHVVGQVKAASIKVPAAEPTCCATDAAPLPADRCTDLGAEHKDPSK
jgi:hypothetical protein